MGYWILSSRRINTLERLHDIASEVEPRQASLGSPLFVHHENMVNWAAASSLFQAQSIHGRFKFAPT
jgi:hypothetical protein